MMTLARPLLFGLLLGLGLTANLAAAEQAKQPKAGRGPAPDVKAATYGPHARNSLDLWKAKSDKPTPLVVYIHGGGFFAGDKSKLPPSLLQLCLKEGLSVASINYRLSSDAPFPAPMHDSARAIQFLRSRAKEWNLDPTKIAATGESAGAGISLWLGFHDDLADPKSNDPVARQSTRLTCMAVKGAQTSYDPRFWEKTIGVRNPWDNIALAPFLGVKPEERHTPKAYKLYVEASPITHVSADDPPAFLYYGGQSDPKARNRAGGHSPKFGEVLKEKLDQLGVECVLRYGDEYKDNWKEAMHADMVRFFVKHFTRSPRQPAAVEEKRPQASGLPGLKIIGQKGNSQEWTYQDDKLVMFGILSKPEGKGPFPAILLSHGAGAGSQSGQFASSKSEEFVKRGFVCIAPYYTHANFTKRNDPLPAGAKSAGDIRENTAKQGDRQGNEKGASAENLRRAVQCIEILESLPYVDKKRICAYGNSMGAFVTIKLASQIPDRLAAAAITAGGIVGKQQGDYLQGNPRAPGAMPLVEDARKIRTPFMIIHGGDDTSVDPRCSALLKKVLDEQRVPNERHVFEGVIHGVHRLRSEEVYRLIRDWFAKQGVLRNP